MIARNEWINSNCDGIKAFNPYSKEDHSGLFGKLEQIRSESNREGYLTLQFSHRAIVLINDKYRSMSVRFPNVLDENSPEQQSLAADFRIRPIIRGLEDRSTGKITRYSAHMVPENAGYIELALEEKGKTYECRVFAETVIAIVSRTKPQQGLPMSWQQQTFATKIRDSLDRLLRSVKK